MKTINCNPVTSTAMRRTHKKDIILLRTISSLSIYFSLEYKLILKIFQVIGTAFEDIVFQISRVDMFKRVFNVNVHIIVYNE